MCLAKFTVILGEMLNKACIFTVVGGYIECKNAYSVCLLHRLLALVDPMILFPAYITVVPRRIFIKPCILMNYKDVQSVWSQWMKSAEALHPTLLKYSLAKPRSGLFLLSLDIFSSKQCAKYMAIVCEYVCRFVCLSILILCLPLAPLIATRYITR